MLLEREAILEAGHCLYSLAYMDIAEENGVHPVGPGGSINETIDRAPDEHIEPIVMRYIGRIEGAWCEDLGLVFYHMGLRDAESQASALLHLLAGCQGYGLSLEDDWGDAFDRANEILRINWGRPPLAINPGDGWEMNEFRELAERQFSEDYGVTLE